MEGHINEVRPAKLRFVSKQLVATEFQKKRRRRKVIYFYDLVFLAAPSQIFGLKLPTAKAILIYSTLRVRP
jgi:hypothetical protein